MKPFSTQHLRRPVKGLMLRDGVPQPQVDLLQNHVSPPGTAHSSADFEELIPKLRPAAEASDAVLGEVLDATRPTLGPALEVPCCPTAGRLK
jgi:hypothetical protein